MALGIAMGIAKMGMGALNYFRGQEASTRAMRDAARFGQQISNTKFINKFAALQAPTRGAQMQIDAVSRQAQASTEAAAEGGLRGAIGATGRTVQGVTDATSKIAAALDKLQLQIDNKFLTEEQRIDLLNKRKDLQLAYQRLAGAQGAGAAGQQMMMSGLAQGLGGLGQTVGGVIEESDLYRKKDAIDDLGPATTPDQGGLWGYGKAAEGTQKDYQDGLEISAAPDDLRTKTPLLDADGNKISDYIQAPPDFSKQVGAGTVLDPVGKMNRMAGVTAHGQLTDLSNFGIPSDYQPVDLKMKALTDADPSVLENYKTIQQNQPEMTRNEFMQQEAMRLGIDLTKFE